jgi:hypothetical protein
MAMMYRKLLFGGFIMFTVNELSLHFASAILSPFDGAIYKKKHLFAMDIQIYTVSIEERQILKR